MLSSISHAPLIGYYILQGQLQLESLLENCMSSDLSPHRTLFHSTIPFHQSLLDYWPQAAVCLLRGWYSLCPQEWVGGEGEYVDFIILDKKNQQSGCADPDRFQHAGTSYAQQKWVEGGWVWNPGRAELTIGTFPGSQPGRFQNRIRAQYSPPVTHPCYRAVSPSNQFIWSLLGWRPLKGSC